VISCKLSVSCDLEQFSSSKLVDWPGATQHGDGKSPPRVMVCASGYRVSHATARWPAHGAPTDANTHRQHPHTTRPHIYLTSTLKKHNIVTVASLPNPPTHGTHISRQFSPPLSRHVSSEELNQAFHATRHAPRCLMSRLLGCVCAGQQQPLPSRIRKL
jgi:hypothetical protein